MPSDHPSGSVLLPPAVASPRPRSAAVPDAFLAPAAAGRERAADVPDLESFSPAAPEIEDFLGESPPEARDEGGPAAWTPWEEPVAEPQPAVPEQNAGSDSSPQTAPHHAAPSVVEVAAPAAEECAPAHGTLREVADRLERLAETLRNGGIEELVRTSSADPLALLVTGFALGSLQRDSHGAG